MAKKYEYRILEYQSSWGTRKIADLKTTFNKLGKEGFELCDHIHDTRTTHFIFKRETKR